MFRMTLSLVLTPTHPTTEDWVSLGDMCLVGEEMQSIGEEHMHADAFNWDHFGTGGVTALAFGQVRVLRSVLGLSRGETRRDECSSGSMERRCVGN